MLIDVNNIQMLNIEWGVLKDSLMGHSNPMSFLFSDEKNEV